MRTILALAYRIRLKSTTLSACASSRTVLHNLRCRTAAPPVLPHCDTTLAQNRPAQTKEPGKKLSLTFPDKSKKFEGGYTKVCVEHTPLKKQEFSCTRRSLGQFPGLLECRVLFIPRSRVSRVARSIDEAWTNPGPRPVCTVPRSKEAGKKAQAIFHG